VPQPEPDTFDVDPKRLQWGTYDHAAEKETGEGDIRRSYSADAIATCGRIRKPFKWRGSAMVLVSMRMMGGVDSGEAYRLVPVRLFEGTPTTYHAKTGTAEGAEAARNDPMGFYHGMTVKQGRESFVLCGPPVRFVAAEQPVRPGTPQS
jgi:hypothetical protein